MDKNVFLQDQSMKYSALHHDTLKKHYKFDQLSKWLYHSLDNLKVTQFSLSQWMRLITPQCCICTL